MYQRLTLAISILTLVASLPVEAALPPRSPQNLDKVAAKIITGKVLAIEVTSRGTGKHLDWVVTLTVEIDSVKKGEGSKGDLLKVQCWQIKERMRGWVGPSGHYNIPAVHSSFTMWLRQGDDGIWEPLAPNGIKLPDGAETLNPAEFKAAQPQ